MNGTVPGRREALMDPFWRKARLAARLVLKRRDGLIWSARDRRLAALLAGDPGVTNRLIHQAVVASAPRRKHDERGLARLH